MIHLGSAEDIGLSLVVLALVFASASLVRRFARSLRALFIPTAVIGGFLVLGLGPEGVGRLTGGSGVFRSPHRGLGTPGLHDRDRRGHREPRVWGMWRQVK